MHILLILIVITNLLTGLRIAAVHRPEVMLWSAFLPQGSVHSLHFSVGVSLLTLLLSYSYYRLCIHRILQPTKRAKTQSRYHKFTCLCSLLRYLENTDKIDIKLVDISQVQGSYRPTCVMCIGK